MYAGVPIDVPTCVNVAATGPVRAAEMALAIPKSVTTAVPPESSTLSGLMSRCTTPRACAYAKARATSRRTLVVSVIERAPSVASRARSDWPSTYGIVKYGRPFVSPAVSTGTMFACCMDAARRISRSNRSALSAAASSGASTLTTTRRPSRFSRATNTRDIPPPPSSRSSVYASPSVACSWSRNSGRVLLEGMLAEWRRRKT